MNISYTDLSLMREISINIEELIILKAKVEGSDILLHFTPSKESYKNLREKGLLNKDNSVSSYTRTLFESSSTLSEGFEQFWQLYPKTDAHAHWPCTRPNLRGSKAAARAAFHKAVKDGFTEQVIIQSLLKEIDFRTKSSVSQNKMTYLKGASKWLKDQDFVVHALDKTSSVNKITPLL